MVPSRRRFLGLVGTLGIGGLAGCNSQSRSNTTGSPTDGRSTAVSGSIDGTHLATLTASDGTKRDWFGTPVVLAGNGQTLVVGSYDDDPHGPQGGAAYVFQRSGDAWTEQAKLVAEDGEQGDLFGSAAISESGTTAVVGALSDDTTAGDNAGSAYVFTASDDTWTQQTKLVPDDGDENDNFGWPLAVSGDGTTALIGTLGDKDAGPADTGAVYVFEHAGGSWHQRATLLPPGASPPKRFGSGLALSGDGTTAIVGAPTARFSDTDDPGLVSVFTDSGGWSHQTTLDPAATPTESFGSSVALAGEYALAGPVETTTDAGETVTGVAVFERSTGSWSQEATLVDPASDDSFGTDVALAGRTALIGASSDSTPGGEAAGTASVFTRSGGTWGRQHRLVADDPEAGDRFGNSVALSNDADIAAVAAFKDDTSRGEESGSVSIFD